MNNDFDLERTQEPRVRVSTDGVNDRDDDVVGDLNVNEIRVFPGQEGDNARVCLDVDSGDLLKIKDSPRDDDDDSDSDIEIEFMVQERENRDVQNKVVTLEAGIISVSDDQIGERENLGSSIDFDDINGEFSIRRSNDIQASLSSNVRASDGHGVTKAGTVKVLGSQFEIGEMVWGKVKSHPWWPGHIYNEAFASSSVRRSRRDGHVLVAFFGDSSYGWFDLTELIPYEPHFTEKSQQINSKNFVRAVEESIDEASRRSALGLSCRCRNLYNFRPTSVPGYMAVDVVDYDPGAIYSVSQIQKARESFHPSEALSFVKQLAAAPRSSNSKSLDFIKHKATALAYRRSIFEEFDETYAQAFGEQPVRPSQLPPELIDKQQSRAALSGPLVFAEALGGRKSSTKARKSKEPSKKDRYLFKRRDEAGEMRTTHISQVHASSSSSSACEYGTSHSAAASYVFQKKDHSLLLNDEMAGTPAKDAPTPGLDVTVSMDASGERVALDSTSDSLQSESSEVVAAKLTEVQGQVPESDQMNKKKKKKKKKAATQPAGEGIPEKSDPSERKKKKMRKIEDSEVYEVKPAARSMQIGISSGEENLEVCHLKNETQVSNSLPQQMGSVPLDEADYELPQMLADLCDLALNPLHGAERNRPLIVRQFFLKFRSLSFLKSSSTPLAESPEESSKTVPSPPLNPSKLSARQDDPTKAGRKRVPPERQEEVAAKRAKKITEAKSLGAEKRAPSLLKNPEVQRPLKPVKGEQQPTKKRVDRPPRVEEPTFLVMKFQSGSSLPSLVELKARFARFGPLDTSLIRVFYKTNTCRVAFLYKQDAHMAYKYAMESKSVFSNVKFMLKPVGPPETQQLGSIPHPRRDDLPGELPSNREAPRAPGPLKSCLKKPSEGDEARGPTRATRVRFNLGGREGGGASSSSNRGVQGQQMVESRNALKSSTEGCPSSLSSSCSSSAVGMDVISSKNQRFIISSHPMELSPPQFHRPPKEVASRSNFNYYNVTSISGPPSGPSPSASKDISQQMMSLLTRCHDVVANVKSVLGYVPYHP